MYLEENHLENTLKYLEMTRMKLYLEMNNPSSSEYRSVNELTNQFYQPLIVNGYIVFQFRLEGAMPHYKEKDKEYLQLVRDYYFNVILSMYEVSSIDVKIDQAVIVIQHIYPSGIHDVDNRNKKYLIDAIQRTCLIKGDDLAIYEEGIWDYRCSPYVHVFLLEKQYLSDFLHHKDQLALKEKSAFDNVIQWDEMKEYFEEEAVKNQILKDKPNKISKPLF
ncbi:hypothetical protein P9B03_09030 [Metasolibacillus meyeri]|uniref:Uncharacterized protein n=1 Tax=Metasolibacillus meyeri TaxID=1071052 RepID=A0AAW9NIX9_9BACL|nr:hypothetical protein [Metasolibacillus meyeri]MEC1178624.1 hypothetical protein [Metasolibacillus meyeri]